MAQPPIVHQYHAPHSARVMVDRDEEHLRLLSIFHFIVGGFNLLVLVLLFLLPLALGPSYYAALNLPQPQGGGPERLIGVLLVGTLQTVIYALNGWSLKNHHNRISCMVLSVIECLSIPLGLILGVSAILVLRRDSVKELFDRAKAQMAPQ